MKKYPHLRETMARQYGVLLTSEQLERLAVGDKRMLRDLKDDSTDTCTREMFTTALVWEILGKDRTWPTYGDGDDCNEAFYFEFFPEAQRKGYKIMAEVMADLKKKKNGRLVRLSLEIKAKQEEIDRLVGEKL